MPATWCDPLLVRCWWCAIRGEHSRSATAFCEILRQRRFVPGCCLASSQVAWLAVDSGRVDEAWDRGDGAETEVDDASSPVRRVFFQENELQPVLVVDVLPDLAKPGLGHEGEGRRVIRRDRDHEPPYAVCHRPIHGACQRFESVALPSVGGKDDVAKLDGMMCIRIQIVRVRPAMKSEVTNHLSGVFQENGPGGPGETVLILCQPRCRELQNCGVAYQSPPEHHPPTDVPWPSCNPTSHPD